LTFISSRSKEFKGKILIKVGKMESCQIVCTLLTRVNLRLKRQKITLYPKTYIELSFFRAKKLASSTS